MSNNEDIWENEELSIPYLVEIARNTFQGRGRPMVYRRLYGKSQELFEFEDDFDPFWNLWNCEKKEILKKLGFRVTKAYGDWLIVIIKQDWLYEESIQSKIHREYQKLSQDNCWDCEVYTEEHSTRNCTDCTISKQLQELKFENFVKKETNPLLKEVYLQCQIGQKESQS